MALQASLLGLGRFFSFLILYTVGRTLWIGDQSVARPLPTHRTTHTDIHASSEIRTHDASIQTGRASSCLRPCSHCDWPIVQVTRFFILVGCILLRNVHLRIFQTYTCNRLRTQANIERLENSLMCSTTTRNTEITIQVTLSKSV
jgi:hypothetical protein